MVFFIRFKLPNYQVGLVSRGINPAKAYNLSSLGLLLAVINLDGGSLFGGSRFLKQKKTSQRQEVWFFEKCSTSSFPFWAGFSTLPFLWHVAVRSSGLFPPALWMNMVIIKTCTKNVVKWDMGGGLRIFNEWWAITILSDCHNGFPFDTSLRLCISNSCCPYRY